MRLAFCCGRTVFRAGFDAPPESTGDTEGTDHAGHCTGFRISGRMYLLRSIQPGFGSERQPGIVDAPQVLAEHVH